MCGRQWQFQERLKASLWMVKPSSMKCSLFGPWVTLTESAFQSVSSTLKDQQCTVSFEWPMARLLATQKRQFSVGLEKRQEWLFAFPPRLGRRALPTLPLVRCAEWASSSTLKKVGSAAHFGVIIAHYSIGRRLRSAVHQHTDFLYLRPATIPANDTRSETWSTQRPARCQQSLGLFFPTPRNTKRRHLLLYWHWIARWIQAHGHLSHQLISTDQPQGQTFIC